MMMRKKDENGDYLSIPAWLYLAPSIPKMCAAAIVMVRDNVHHQMQPYMQVLNAKAVRQIIGSIRTGPIIVTNMAILYPWIYDKRKKKK